MKIPFNIFLFSVALLATLSCGFYAGYSLALKQQTRVYEVPRKLESRTIRP